MRAVPACYLRLTSEYIFMGNCWDKMYLCGVDLIRSQAINMIRWGTRGGGGRNSKVNYFELKALWLHFIITIKRCYSTVTFKESHWKELWRSVLCSSDKCIYVNFNINLGTRLNIKWLLFSNVASYIKDCRYNYSKIRSIFYCIKRRLVTLIKSR